MKSTVYFATFSDGSVLIKGAGERIVSQARGSKIFSECLVFDKQELKKLSKFSHETEKIMVAKNRGYGFFVWKPLLLKALLESVVPENSILVYCDSGTELVTNDAATKRMKRVISRLDEQPVIAFESDYPEYFYTKRKCMSLIQDVKFGLTNQIEATSVLIRNCPEARNFVGLWVLYSEMDNFTYLNDVIDEEHEHFIEHRCDQSIFSILFKNSGYIPLKMTQVLGYLDTKTRLSFFRRLSYNSFFLWQIRNRTGETYIRSYQYSNFMSFIFLPLQYTIQISEYLKKISRTVEHKFLHLRQ